MKPNLFIPGAPKSGTSSLHVYLNEHPSIQMSKIKEPHNYSVDDHYEKRFDPTYKYSYDNIFHHSTGIKYYGESSTTHMATIIASRRIKNDVPDAKFIFLLRDPIDRILSHYNWLDSLGLIHKPFIKEIKEWADSEVNPNHSFKGNYKNYIEFSLYGKHIQRFQSFFGKGNVHITTNESLREDPEKELNKCFSFLGLESFSVSQKKENVTIMPEIDKRPQLLKITSSIVPLKLKNNINNVFKINRLIKNVYFYKKKKHELNKREVEWLKSTLNSDVNLLRTISDLDFNEWEYFN